MLKYVHTSPHRNSIASLRRNLSDFELPKHVRQSSSPSGLCVSCSPSIPSGTDTNPQSGSPGIEYNLQSSKRNGNECYRCYKNNNKSVRLKEENGLDNSFTFPHRENDITDDSTEVNDTDVGNVSSLSISYPTETVSAVNIDRCLNCGCHKSTNDSFENDNKGKEDVSGILRASTPIETSMPPKEYGSSSDSGNETESRLSSPSQSSPLPVHQPSKAFSRKRDRETKVLQKSSNGRCDTMSLDSSMSCSTTSREDVVGSLSSSALSLPDNLKQTMVRVWVRCLMQEMEYKTISLSPYTTSREVVSQLLSKFRMKHRDPNLFYLTMEITIRKSGAEVRTCLRLDDASFPAQLVECHPKERSRLALRMRRGGLIRIYDQGVCEGSYYKSLLVSERISCVEVMSLVLLCNKIENTVKYYALFEVWKSAKKDTMLAPLDEPMIIASEWEDKDSVRFEMRRISNSIKQRFFSNDVIINHGSRTIDVIDSSTSSTTENMNKNTENEMLSKEKSFNKVEILINDTKYIDSRDKNPTSDTKLKDSNTSLDTYVPKDISSTDIGSLGRSHDNKTEVFSKSIIGVKMNQQNGNYLNIDVLGSENLTQSKVIEGSVGKRRPPAIPEDPPSPDVNETTTNDKIEFKTYNDYENYFYI